MPINKPPKVFLSYSSTQPAHHQWVLNFDTQLRAYGIEATLEAFDLKLGQDRYAYLESALNKDYDKIIIIVDSAYCQEANARDGNGGTQAQILSPSIYSNPQQQRIIPIYTESDIDGNPMLPNFLKARSVVDFSEPAHYEQSYAALYLAIVGEPLYQRAPLGEKPDLQHLRKMARRSTVPKELTSIPRLNPNQLVGRKKDLQQVREQLMNQQQVVVVNGMGGLGKTALAQAYVMQYYKDYGHIAWVSLEPGSQNVLIDFTTTRGLAKSLQISQEQHPKTEDLFAEIMLAFKRLIHTPCLLILDNAEETLLDYYDELPNQPHWHLLATSRIALNEFTSYQLGFLSKEEAIQLFKKHYVSYTLTDAFIEELVEEVDYHTLTIEILAKMAEHSGYEEDQLRQALPSNLLADVRTRHRKRTIERITDYLAAVFAKEVQQLSTVQHQLLRQLACLPSEHHGIEVLEALLVHNEIEDRNALLRHLNRLVATGWLLSSNDVEQGKTYKLHRIVQEVVGQLLGVEGKIAYEQAEGLIEQVRLLLYFDEWKDNPVERFTWVPFGMHVEALFGMVSVKRFMLFENRLAELLRHMGNFSTAKKIHQKLVKKCEEQYGYNHVEVATHCSCLAVVLKALGEHEESRELLERAIKIDEGHYESTHPVLAVRYSNLATVLQDLGDYESSRDLLERVIEINEDQYESTHPVLAVSYSNLALVLQDLGEYEGARVLLERAIKICEDHYESTHPALAVRYSNLGMVLKALGKYEEAQVLLERAIKINEGHYESTHPVLARSYSNLALVLKALGEHEGARALLERAIKICEDHYESTHPVLAVSYSNLGMVFQNLGKYEEAQVLLERAIEIDEGHYESTHPALAVSYSNLALVLQDLGEYEGARTLLERAIAIEEEHYESTHPVLAISYGNLAGVLLDLKELDAALHHIKKAQTIFLKNFPPEHPHCQEAAQYLQTIQTAINNS